MTSQQDKVNSPPMRLVIVESPYAARGLEGLQANIDYARQCLAGCLRRNESPLASHLLYTQPGILDDNIPSERALGIAAGLAWGRIADATVVYIDRGISPGMREGIARAKTEGRPLEYRRLWNQNRRLEKESRKTEQAV
jgi:hypothetical protein